MQIKQSGFWKGSIHLHQKKITDVKAFLFNGFYQFKKKNYTFWLLIFAKKYIQNFAFKAFVQSENQTRQLMEEFEDKVLVKFQNK